MSDGNDILNPTLAAQLSRDGFRQIGRFHIHENIFHLALSDRAAGDWVFALYAWVSTLGEGCVMRIGKSEGPLHLRLRAYKKSLDDAMSGVLAPGQYYMGDTQPWEVVGWKHWAGADGSGLIFARQLEHSQPGTAAKQLLKQEESRLITEYDPPLCGVSRSGRAAKRLWESQFGSTTPVRRRGQAAF